MTNKTHRVITAVILTICLFACSWLQAQTGIIYHVDTYRGNDNFNGLTHESAFETIQKGIEIANTGDMILVWPGTYSEDIDFMGKEITVKSAADAAKLMSPGGTAVSFHGSEQQESILENFVIMDSFIGIHAIGTNPTINHVTVVNNDYGILADTGANPTITNSIFWNNSQADLVECEADFSWVESQIMDTFLGLTAYWRFEEGDGSVTIDHSTNNLTAILHPSAADGPEWTPGLIGNALRFDGEDDYVEVAPEPVLNVSFITMTAWIKINSFSSEDMYVVNRQMTQSDTFSLYARESDNRWVARVRLNGEESTDVAVASNDPISSEWTHLAATYDGAALKMYLNGIQQQEIVYHPGIIDPDYPGILRIGGHPEYDFNNNFNGLIDEVLIYNRALQAQEINQLFVTGAAGYGLADPIFADPLSYDFHLKSQAGRFYPQDPSDPNMFGELDGLWAMDLINSPCLDAGDPIVVPTQERMPNGGRVNQGAYANTDYASMSPWPLIADLNKNGIIDLQDFFILSSQWLTALPWAWNP
ncbi:MAG: hypothetical protein JW860_05490 [Sedimentisphaerales bacterium]|nr:hypothetical protein [Sedimentisphaerales bacterium]